MKKIVLISTGQPTLNPRLVKEALTLQKEGFDVTILYQHWSDWATIPDKNLIKRYNLKATLVGGNPESDIWLYWITRIIFKLIKKIASQPLFTKRFSKLALARTTWLLINKAKTIKADLYIAHNLGALSAAVIAAKKNNAKCGFDAEDFHRFETSNDTTLPEVACKIRVEEKYFPNLDYITAASPLIAKTYIELFNKDIIPILNVFPKTILALPKNNTSILKLFWFSQTIGSNRGLENIIKALNISENKFELHLLGEIEYSYQKDLENLNLSSESSIYFHPPIAENELYNFAAQFDIGLATEPGFSRNNDYALSNKIFTYIQSGLLTIASNTEAQSGFINKYPYIGSVFKKNNPQDLISVLDFYHNNRPLLLEKKLNAYLLGQNELNWEVESEKFLKVIHQTLSN